ncbi:GLPGLI family protein [Chryseobacterium formosus]|uniref:GLPGLI family protein n=1 Tax=Chryseobacterium formosus TaxID=1537363 RepID=A0ABT3XME6_9FLAO|nr:GLPGLI family protein [Chryseobacterium formosus]MCX8523311.1 GLPGLI family protein [Chryseobacterium formosus]
MKTTLNLSFLLLSVLVFSQTNRFFYDYKFVSDSTDKANVKNAVMLLDIDQKGSVFMDNQKYIADSTQNAELAKQMKLNSGSFTINRSEKPGQISYKVTKQYPEFKTYLFTRVASDSYKVEENKKPEWKILPDKQKIGEYSAQKATTTYLGRQWTAWFTTEIPFQDGPYKFYGLPGLIVKIEDKTGTHSMTLAGNKKINKVENEEVALPNGMQIYGVGTKDIEATKEQFKKVWKNYKNDPTKNMREMMSKNSDTNKVIFKTKSADGREISDPNQVFREMEKNAKEGFKKNNNPIELDLY